MSNGGAMTDFNEFWLSYPKDLCHNKKGSKFNAQKAWKKLKPEEQEQVVFDMKALIRYDRQDKDAYRWPMCSTFLNQRYWQREIESTAELRERQKFDLCQCGLEVHGPRFTECTDCLLKRVDPWKKRRIQTLKDMGLYVDGESVSEVIGRCKVRGSVNGSFSLAHLFAISRQFLIDNAD